MNSFQILGLGVFGVLMVINLNRLVRGRASRRMSLAWLGLCLAGAAILLVPDETTRIARALGIRRGADLLLYTSVLAGLTISFLIYSRMREIDSQITLVVRQLALIQACPPDDPGSIHDATTGDLDAELAAHADARGESEHSRAHGPVS